MNRHEAVGWVGQAAAFLQLGRPHFLVGGFLLNGLGVAIARYAGAVIDWQTLLWGQVAVTTTQLMTHYANDYFDLEADRANRTPTRWSGGSRVLPEHRIPPQVALIAALTLGTLALGAVAIVALVIQPGPLALPLLLAALFLSWAYSAPPFKLHSRGVGEVCVALLVPGLTPLMGFYLQTGHLTILPLLAALPLILLQFAMLLAIEFPDAESDAMVGKRTLVVRIGAQRGSQLYLWAVALVYPLLAALVWAGLPLLAGGAILLGMPLAAWQAWRTRQGVWADAARWEGFAFWSITLLIGTAAAELAAFLVLIGTGASPG